MVRSDVQQKETNLELTHGDISLLHTFYTFPSVRPGTLSPSLCGSIMYYMIPSNECRVDSPLILYADVQYMGNGKKRGRRNRKENVCSFCFDLNTEICFLVGNRQSTEEDDVQWSDDS